MKKLSQAKRVSKPGLRVYGVKIFQKFLTGLGAILSTSGGLLTDKEARQRMLVERDIAYV